MTRNVLLWIVAFIITLVSAYYQRVTGPTYPLSGHVQLNGRDIPFRLERSHGGESNAGVHISVNDQDIRGALEWRRNKTNDPWESSPLTSKDGILMGELPAQPPAGKLVYRVLLSSANDSVMIPSQEGTVIRFKGEVPLAILILHVVAMFGAMLLSTRSGLEFLHPNPRLATFALWTIGFLAVGGMILGPIVQKYAFGAYWTGWPVGTDLTDNKTFFALLAWVIALIGIKRTKRPGAWALAAAIVLFVVYLVPHSVWGSELDYSKIEATSGPR